MLLAIGLFVTLISAGASGLFFTSNEPQWNDLKTTLYIPGQTPLSYAFQGLPLTASDAAARNWKKTSTDCSNGGVFNGFRYIPDDNSIATLYDVNGQIAGFQMLPDQAKILSGGNTYRFGEQPMILNDTVDGTAHFMLTAYFIDPATICTSGRTAAQAKSEGVGNGLWFQNGPTPSSLVVAPMKRTDAANQNWVNSRCLPMNGYHNFYESDKWQETNCNTIRPSWLFYNRDGDLMGFGFSVVGNDNAPRYQHPPGLIVKFVLGLGDKSPKCAEEVTFSNINVYFQHVPQTILC